MTDQHEEEFIRRGAVAQAAHILEQHARVRGADIQQIGAELKAKLREDRADLGVEKNSGKRREKTRAWWLGYRRWSAIRRQCEELREQANLFKALQALVSPAGVPESA